MVDTNLRGEFILDRRFGILMVSWVVIYGFLARILNPH